MCVRERERRMIFYLYIGEKCFVCFFLFFKVVHLRQRLDNTVSSSRDRSFPFDATVAMIQSLIDCDEFQDIATLRVYTLLNIFNRRN